MGGGRSCCGILQKVVFACIFSLNPGSTKRAERSRTEIREKRTEDRVLQKTRDLVCSVFGTRTMEVEDEQPWYTSEMLGRYCTLECKLGSGTHGSVWLASCSSKTAQRPFAVKLLKASDEAMVEIAAYRTIGEHSRHPNLLFAPVLIADDRCVNIILEPCQLDILEYVLKHAACHSRSVRKPMMKGRVSCNDDDEWELPPAQVTQAESDEDEEASHPVVKGNHKYSSSLGERVPSSRAQVGVVSGPADGGMLSALCPWCLPCRFVSFRLSIWIPISFAGR